MLSATSNASIDTLGSLIANGAMTATARIMQEKKIATPANLDPLVAALKHQSALQLDQLLADCRAALDSHMGEPMYRQILNAGCIQIALAALKECELFPQAA